MKILLVGNGAREHCVGESLVKSGRADLFVYGSKTNPGLKSLAKEYFLGSLSDFSAILEFAKKIKPDFAFIGPEDPIAAGVADSLLNLEIHSIAPLQTAARLESSKSFTRDLIKKYGISGNPKFKIFLEQNGVKEFIEELNGQFVVKADGLKGGKGVKVFGEHLQSIEEGINYAKECIAEFGRVIVEEKLTGEEFSLMSFSDGKHLVSMPPVRDHKRAFEGDKGENTGGMGSYSDANHLLPFLKKEHILEAHAISEKILKALFEETGVLYKGIMYGGFMLTHDGLKVIEYNARFGDPEVLNILPIMKTDFVDVCEGILKGMLDAVKVEFENLATVCKYIVPEGYPDNPKAGEKVEVEGGVIARSEATKQSQSQGLKMYYASVDQKPDGLYLTSSRSIAFVGIAGTLEQAEKIAEKATASIKGPVFHRRDIGTKELIMKSKVFS